MSKQNQPSKFKLIFENIVAPLVPQIEAEMDSEFKRATNFHVKDLEHLCKQCESFYEQKKLELKKVFYGDKFSVSDKEGLLFDIHKIASISCNSLIKHKVFAFDEDDTFLYLQKNNITDTSWIVNNALVNYKLAFHVSVSMIYYKLIYDANNQENFPLADTIMSHNELILYNARKGHESFSNSIILDLAKRDIHKRSFDYFLYSALLFQLEEYNIEFFKNL